jgi:hypothetical protein
LHTAKLTLLQHRRFVVLLLGPARDCLLAGAITSFADIVTT